MTPDSTDSRIARLEQQTKDLEIDVRTFAPLIESQAVIKERVGRLKEDMDALASAQREIITRLDKEKKERDDMELARLRDQKTNRTLLWVAAIGLVGTFFSSTAVVIAAVL